MKLPSEIEVKQQQLDMFMFWLGQTEWPLKLLRRDQVADEADSLRREIENLRAKANV